jgi:hypothetical protein
MAARRLDALRLTDVEQSELAALVARPKMAQALALRARIILACARRPGEQGHQLGVHAMTVGKWRRRFLAKRIEGPRDEPRPSTARTTEDTRIEAVITCTLESQPDGARELVVADPILQSIRLSVGAASICPRK